MRYPLLALPALCLLLAACVARPDDPPVARDLTAVNVGQQQGYHVAVVARGLRNPSFISFRPSDGALTVTDSGHGRVVLVRNGEVTPIVEGLDTQFWTHVDGEASFQVGPLAALWYGDDRLAVNDGGKSYGQEALLFYRASSRGAPHNEILGRSNVVGPTTDREGDRGEGNFTGMALGPEGRYLYVCSQGVNGRGWVLRADIEARTLAPFVAAGDHGIEASSPMQALIWRGNLLVLYNNALGRGDGVIVEWSLQTREPLNTWRLPGLVDPMGLAQVPGAKNEFVITDNNRGGQGKIARVTLQERGNVGMRPVADNVPGPVHCAFGPDGRLYVTCLGEAIDQEHGLVLSVKGFE